MPNQGFTYGETLDRRHAGLTVLARLCAFTHSTEAQWRERIAAGFVTLEGRVAHADDILQAGAILAWARPPWEEPEAPLAYAVLHEDEHLLAVAKPSGLPTLPGADFLEHTLLHLVRQRYPGADPLHRLGRGTSGLVLFARTEAARRELSKAWRDHDLLKVYRAWITGHPAVEAFTVDTPIGPIAHPLLGTVHGASPGGRASRSEAVVLERRADGTSLVEVTILTGRPHQIRIHMAAAGHPLVGDPLYAPGGGLLGEGSALPGDLGYRLHSMRLEGRNPMAEQPFVFHCEPPPILRTGSPS
ncbi:MAG TPA: RluA family pseudouridine synthase [Holophagaceae bacterium]|nr:RluA family pseudouridine synthase [Holophagaceae bacterium]